MKIEDTINEYIDSLVTELHLSINTKEAYKKDLSYYCFYLKDKNIIHINHEPFYKSI